MEKYVELAKNEIEQAIHSYGERETANEWKSAEEEFKKISYKVEELICDDKDIYTVKVSHQAIRFAQDIPNNWEILGNVLYGYNTEKILPCVLFTWLLNMNKNLWKNLQNGIMHKHSTFNDKLTAKRLAKSQSKTPNANDEIKITDLFFYNVSEIPNDYDLAFMMVIRFLTLFELSICANADKNFCMTWFESKYKILRHIFTYDENKSKTTRGDTLDEILYELLHLKNDERAYSKEINELIKDKIMQLEFSNKYDVENKTEELRMDIRQLEKSFFLLFRYELFKSNYELNKPLSNIADSLVQMCQCFDADIHIKKLTVKNSKNNNSQSDFTLKAVTAKIESISKLYLIEKPSNNIGKTIVKLDENDDGTRIILIDDCEDTINYDNEQPYANFPANYSEYCYSPTTTISKMDMLYSPHDIILKGTLKILSAKYNACNAEFTLSCDKLEIDNAHMINTQFNFKANSKVLKNKEKKDKWYNSIFLLLANEI